MFSTMRTISTVLVLGMGLSVVSSAVFVDTASAERKGQLGKTYNW
jgi:hypothetical protein